jgi:hypothetical protein
VTKARTRTVGKLGSDEFSQPVSLLAPSLWTKSLSASNGRHTERRENQGRETERRDKKGISHLVDIVWLAGGYTAESPQ